MTGASRGIGSALAEGLAAFGATVVRIGRSASPEQPDIKGVEYVSCDICDGETFKAVCQKTFEAYGSLDILVNAAGISLPAGDPEHEMDRFAEIIKVNLEGAYASSLAAAEFMRKGNGGAIVNMTSINSMLGFPGNPGYVASKGGLRALTQALAVDFGKDNIRVNAVAPGYVHTAMTNGSFNDPKRHKARLSRMILQRWGEPQDMIGAVVFLTSSASAYMTGQEIIVDGGWSAKGLDE